MFGHANGSDAGAAASVRDAKSLVQIQVANIGAVIARPAKTDLRVHVGPIEINLAAMRMHDVADIADGRLKDAMRARVGDHERAQITRMLVGLGPQISQVDIAILEARDRYYFVSSHDCAGRIGSVR